MLNDKIGKFVCLTLVALIPFNAFSQSKHPARTKRMEQPSTDNKLIIYQLLPRLFGNVKTVNKPNGSIDENGSGKFNDISDKALQEIKNMGFTHVWFTGVIEHATMTD
ncbi:MAG: hypothetical protein JWR09_2533, partial [Mucilaginibacter sp.]|nr:hypothetical protein [Mucilaginibacter sp.]